MRSRSRSTGCCWCSSSSSCSARCGPRWPSASCVAEPFLIVGIIASIKAIVVTSLEAGDLHGEAFDDAMLEIGVLGGVVLLLAVASFLVRRKEREPAEHDG